MPRLRPPLLAALLAATPLAMADDPPPLAAETQAESTPKPYVAEASLPEGFPMPGPAEAVSLKTYPTYRVAVAEGGNAFWKLFGHIQREDIPMTAPVTMSNTADPADAGEGNVTDPLLDRGDMSMGFLYPATDVGDLGEDTADASVTVHDVDPMTVLSYGFFGTPYGDRLDTARAAITAALDSDHPDLAFAGPWRLLGYNGPSVPADRRYYEVQRPVEPKTKAEIDPANNSNQPDAPSDPEA